MKELFKILLINFLVTFTIFKISPIETKNIKWNVSNNFNNSLYLAKNVELNNIDGKPAFYSINKTRHNITTDTDLYLSFDTEKMSSDETNNYKIIYKNYLISNNKSLYKKSAYFIGGKDKIELTSTADSFFQSGATLGSFSISFWIYPATFSNNETILTIGTQFFDNTKEVVENQSITAKLSNGKIVWNFEYVFSIGIIKKKMLSMESLNRILPEKWTHINLVFNSYTGIIKEYINGKEEGIIVATEDGTLNSSTLSLKFHSSNSCVINIAPSFYGAIDEFVIQKNIDESYISNYNSSNGIIVSKVKDFGPGGIILEKIIPKDLKENNSALLYYYRISNKPFHENDEISKDLMWIPLESLQITPVNIRYFQWKVMLLAGNNTNFSPRFYEINLEYKHNEPPAIPKNVRVLFDDNKIKIKWSLNTEKDLKGYKIYYGTKSNFYFGKDAGEGISPIDVGLKNNFELSGINKNEIYYISITAYDDEKHSHESGFSEEVSIRPIKTF